MSFSPKQHRLLVRNITKHCSCTATLCVGIGYSQYLNCNILHGGTLLLPWPNAFGMRKYFSRNYVIPFPKLNEDQKKAFVENWRIRWRPKKKKVFTAIWDYIWPEFVGFIRAGWLFFVWSSSAQISMGKTRNLDGGTLTLDRGTSLPASPYNLRTDYQRWSPRGLHWPRGHILESLALASKPQILGLGLEASSPWTWPRSLRSSKIALSSAREQHYFLNRQNFVGKRQKPRGKFANTFFGFRSWSIGWAKQASPPTEISPTTKMWQKSLLFVQFQFLFSVFRLHQ